MRNNKRRGGFTLLEILVALFIFTVMSSIAFWGLNAVIETNNMVKENRLELKNLSIFFGRLERDLRGVVNRPSRGFDKVSPPLIGIEEPNSDERLLVFSTMGGRSEPGAYGSIRRIGYRYNENRIELMVWPATDFAASVEPAVYTAFDYVEDVVMKYMDSSGVWLDSWNEKSLPAAVKIEVWLDSTRVITSVFSIH